MEQSLAWLEKYRVLVGVILTGLILGVGVWLIWLDFHRPSASVVTTKKIVQPTSSSITAKLADDLVTTSKASLININTADEVELDKLPGIGPAIAKRIVDYRRAHGQFKRVDDLTKVSGIGPKTLAKFKDNITTGGD